MSPHGMYAGPIEIVSDGGTLTVEAKLSCFFQPIDGTVRWQGHTQPDPAVTGLAQRPGRTQLRFRVPGGEVVSGKLGEQNPWGGFRVTGQGRPPYEVDDVSLED